MKLLAAQIPGLDEIFSAGQTPGSIKFDNLAAVLTGILSIVTTLVGFLAFIWLIWGAFQYLTAGGKKEDLAKARSRITWAIVGLLITMLAFSLSQFISRILPPTTITPIL